MMAIVFELAGRNIKVFLRDKTAVFFSLLAVIIIIGLYALFLGNTTENSIKSVAGDRQGIRFLVDSWIMAGIIVVNTITASLGLFGVMVEDEAKKRLYGFLVAPISRGKIVAGYVIASWAVGMILSLLALVAAEIYIVASGGEWLPAMAWFKVLGLVVLNVFSASCMVFFMVSFVRSSNGFATLSTILGTIIGFITGIYLPIGVLPETVQAVVKFVPATHGAALMRQAFMQQPLDMVFAGAPTQATTGFLKDFGVIIMAGDQQLSVAAMIIILILSGFLFLGLSVLSMNRRKRS